MKNNNLLILFLFLFPPIACNNNTIDMQYSDGFYWAYYPDKTSYPVDVFFIAPTVFFGNDSVFNMNISNEELRHSFIGAINMQKSIYDNETNFFAPFYRQASLKCYELRYYDNNPQVDIAFERAYIDIENAFNHYLGQSRRPFILAGFSQGSELLLQLLKNRFDDSELQNRLIAAYLIGWRITNQDVTDSPHIQLAQSNKDLGVIVSFNSEAEFINQTLIVPETTFSINPLSWTTDISYADKSLNIAAVFTDYNGNIVNEIPELTGAYICSKRGTLKVPDINPEEYPPMLELFQQGNYHIYDYQFFFRNLQENLNDRTQVYFKNRK